MRVPRDARPQTCVVPPTHYHSIEILQHRPILLERGSALASEAYIIGVGLKRADLTGIICNLCQRELSCRRFPVEDDVGPQKAGAELAS